MWRTIGKSVLIGSLFVCLLAPVATPERAMGQGSNQTLDREAQLGDEVVVVFRDGRRMNGEFISLDATTLVIDVTGVEIELPVNSYRDLLVLEPAKLRYERMRDMVGDDARKRMNLAEWCRRRGMYEEALNEVDRALEIDPYFEGAQKLRTLIEQEWALQKVRGTGQGMEDEQSEKAGDFDRRPLPGEFPLLTEEQINLIKVYELDITDPPRLVIDRDVVEQLLRDYSDSPLVPTTREGREEIFGWDARKVLDLMFRVRARDLYGRVRVLGQPKSMKMFRDFVHTKWLLNHAATTKCHGGTNAGDFQLTNRNPRSEASVFTNFVIIDKFRTSTGQPLIDWEDPERSVLLQLGLPRDDSAYPHPEVKGWRPVFRSRESRGYQQAVDWMRAMYRPRPEYPFDYQLPGENREPAEGVER